MHLVKILIFIVKTKIVHFGEIYRLISFHYFFSKLKTDIRELRILDIGFNKGVYRWYFVDFLQCDKYSGIEIDRNYLDIYPDTFYHNFEKNKLQSKYDLIFCSHVLEHVNNDFIFLDNIIYSLSDDNGKLIIRVPIPTDNNMYFRAFNSKYHEHEEHERDGYTLSALSTLLKNHGLKIEKYFLSMGNIGMRTHTIFEILRDYQVRFQRMLQIPFIILSLVEIYFINNTSNADVLVLAIKKSKK